MTIRLGAVHGRECSFDRGHRGRAARLAYISEFIEQAKASGLVQQAIERAGLPGYKVASSKTN